MIKCLQRTTRGAAGNSRAQRSRLPTHNERRRGQRPGHHDQVPSQQRALPRESAGRSDQVPVTHNQRRRGQWPGHHDQVLERRRGQRPGAAIKYLRCTTSAAAGNGLGTAMKYLQRSTSGAAGNGRAQRSSTCDAQLASPRATAWALRSRTCNAQPAAPRATARRSDQVTAMHNERR